MPCSLQLDIYFNCGSPLTMEVVIVPKECGGSLAGDVWCHTPYSGEGKSSCTGL